MTPLSPSPSLLAKSDILGLVTLRTPHVCIKTKNISTHAPFPPMSPEVAHFGGTVPVQSRDGELHGPAYAPAPPFPRTPASGPHGPAFTHMGKPCRCPVQVQGDDAAVWGGGGAEGTWGLVRRLRAVMICPFHTTVVGEGGSIIVQLLQFDCLVKRAMSTL